MYLNKMYGLFLEIYQFVISRDGKFTAEAQNINFDVIHRSKKKSK